jgi:anthranilate phosphoribosyltransferase
MKKYIQKVQSLQNLSRDEIEKVMHSIMSGDAASDDIAAMLLALNQKGPTIDEITGAARVMRRFSVPVESDHDVVLDTCGTGGDQKHTFNISTITAFVVAGAGVVVAKHGNRSVSSQCGSADVLEAMGVNINFEAEHLRACLDQVGIAFLFAQRLHPAMKTVAPIRKKLKTKTIFNILGPLSNPAKATHQIMGVYSRDLVEPMCHVLKNMGLRRALVVYGSDGLDEITTTGKSFVGEFNGETVVSYDISPQELGLALAQEKDLKGGNVQANVQIAKAILDGKKGPQRDIVVLNAAYALYISEKVKTINDGLTMAAESIDSGRALGKLESLKEFTNRAQ